jgi:hypothetical protein
LVTTQPVSRIELAFALGVDERLDRDVLRRLGTGEQLVE